MRLRQAPKAIATDTPLAATDILCYFYATDLLVSVSRLLLTDTEISVVYVVNPCQNARVED